MGMGEGMMRQQQYHHQHRHFLTTQVLSEPPANGSTAGSTTGFYSGDTSFENNMLIILAALLFALVCGLGFNSMLRCALRCTRRLALIGSSSSSSSSSAQTTSGLDSAATLKNDGDQVRPTHHLIPVLVYESGLNIPSMDCPICLGEFVEGEKIRVLPKCRHGFHVKCIDKWLVSHPSCPTCRGLLLFDQHPTCSSTEEVSITI